MRDTIEYNIGLMTKNEFFDKYNPEEKYHPNSAYQYSIDRDFKNFLKNGTISYLQKYNVKQVTDSNNDLIKILDDRDNLIAYTHNGITNALPSTNINSYNSLLSSLGFPINYDKYPLKSFKKIFTDIKSFEDTDGKLLQNKLINGENIRFYVTKGFFGDDVKAVNSSNYIIGSAQDEWGCVLIYVVEEYKGNGIGLELKKQYTKLFPDKQSGGYTIEGANNAYKFWNHCVHEMLSAGMYSKLVNSGEITIDRVKSILKSAEPIKQVKKKDSDGLLCLMLVDDSGIILYDSKITENFDNKYIYGHCHFHELENKPNTFHIWSIDYKSQHKKFFIQTVVYILTNIIKGDLVIKGNSDFIDFEGIKLDGDRIVLSEDYDDFKLADCIKNNKEVLKNDKYDEIKTQIQEMAEFDDYKSE